jgi:general L-amino acid transport system substrate-binding protein
VPRKSTWTMSRDVGQQLAFVGVSYYDGQSFMVRAERGLVSAMELNGAKVCVQSGTTTETNAASWFRQQGLSNEILSFPTRAALLTAYAAAQCNAFTADCSAITAERMGFDQPEAHVILPEVISKEPLGPAVRKEDAAWGDVVRRVLFARASPRARLCLNLSLQSPSGCRAIGTLEPSPKSATLPRSSSRTSARKRGSASSAAFYPSLR